MPSLSPDGSGERVHVALVRVAGYRRLTSGDNDAQLFAQLHTLRIIQLNGLTFSTGWSISPAPRRGHPRKHALDFHEVSRADVSA
jgi:hypothetical protein